MVATMLLLLSMLFQIATAIPATPNWFDQITDHFSPSTSTYKQRYYMNDKYFGGPGSPIFAILGGEGGIPPSTGIYYPFINDVLAKTYSALVIEPEHRFYGESLPFGKDSFTLENLRFMTTQQALADAAYFIRAHQALRNCTSRGTPGYCPVLTIGGSYPGFLSAMMRLRYPAVVDMAYAASAPMKFYSQEVGQYEYYTRITETAETAVPDCSQAVLSAFSEFEVFVERSNLTEIKKQFALCPWSYTDGSKKAAIADDILFLAQQTFANLNMAYYPPNQFTSLSKTCKSFVAAAAEGKTALLGAIRSLLLTDTQMFRATMTSGKTHIPHQPLTEFKASCFDLEANLPSGRNTSARCGDWSGCGVGRDGEMWDYQTCSFEVEQIGFGSGSQMFPERRWTLEWLRDHCAKRFGVQPQATALANLWGFRAEDLRSQSSRIVFTNGLNDGWSVGGFLEDLDPNKDLLSINLPNGAHHSDLSHALPIEDTQDVQAAHSRISALVGKWIQEIHADQMRVYV